MKCQMCSNTKHLQTCRHCNDFEVLYCRVCIRKHFKKVHKEHIEQRVMAFGDMPDLKKQMRYHCECGLVSPKGGFCPQCGLVLKRVK